MRHYHVEAQKVLGIFCPGKTLREQGICIGFFKQFLFLAILASLREEKNRH